MQPVFQFQKEYRAAGLALFTRDPIKKTPLLFMVKEEKKSNAGPQYAYSFPGGKIEDRDK
jgi:8-oxo-dGTP pyrophosphatase MutT (NUDIX family)